MESWTCSCCCHQAHGRQGSSDSFMGVPPCLAIAVHPHVRVCLRLQQQQDWVSKVFLLKAKQSAVSRFSATPCSLLSWTTACLDSAKSLLWMRTTSDQCNRYIDYHTVTPGTEKPKRLFKLRAGCLDSSSFEEGLGSQWIPSWICQQHALADTDAYWTTEQEKSVASRPREETSPLYLALVILQINYCVQFRDPSARKALKSWNKSSWGPLRWLGGWD